MFRISKVYQPVIAAPTVRANDAFDICLATDNCLRCKGFGIGHNLNLHRF
ncbi:MAG: hypothetical protein LBT21_03950 [Oscillospiraceae bacterium]|nr:hypothetical protein [Oscillospiraceae bacterium]